MIFIRSPFKTWNKMQNRCAFCIKFWLFHPALYCQLRTAWVELFLLNKQTKSVKRDKSYLLTVPKQILQTKRLPNSSSVYIARHCVKSVHIRSYSRPYLGWFVFVFSYFKSRALVFCRNSVFWFFSS